MKPVFVDAPTAAVAVPRLVINPLHANILQNNEDFIRIYSTSEKIKQLHVARQIFEENGFFPFPTG